MKSPGVCAITGATGFVGSALAARFEAAGWTVIRLGRGPESAVRMAFDLRGQLPTARAWTERKVDVLVHCAYDFSAISWEEIRRSNVDATIELLRRAEQGGVRRIIFISSMAAFPGCRSLYGRGKLEVERVCRERGYAVVRPGLVYGEKSAGIVGKMASVADRFPFVPMIGSGRQQVYPCHIDDLSRLVLALAARDDRLERPVLAASLQACELRQMVSAAAKRRPVRFLPIPWRMIWLALKFCEGVGLRAPFRSDSVVGLTFADPAPDSSASPDPAVAFRPLGRA